jgi:hypothetical protein
MPDKHIYCATTGNRMSGPRDKRGRAEVEHQDRGLRVQ